MSAVLGRLSLASVIVASALLAGCGGDDAALRTQPPDPPPAPQPADFPSVRGKTLAEVAQGLREGPIFAPSVSQLKVGRNRVGFALFDRARKQIDASAVAVYTARPDGSHLRGPYVARRESIDVKTEYRSRQAAADLANGDTFYVASVPLQRRKGNVFMALARMDGRLVRSAPQELPPAPTGGPPDVGEKAIAVHTRTEADVGGDLSELSTRLPPARAMHQTDFADAVGKKPIVLLFATPQLCQTRVCGPVVDVAEQVRTERGEGVTFIHQEIYRENKVEKGFRAEVGRWRLPTEPWAFVIDRSGRVSARFEGAFSAGELSRAIAKVK